MPETKTQIPEGYMRDARGALIPLKMIKDIDKKRDILVRSLVEGAIRQSVLLAEFKRQAMTNVEDFVSLSAKKFDVKLGGKKGNITLFSFDGEYKIQRAIADRIYFDERLQVAKELIDECIRRWTKDSRAEIMVLIDHAFQVDKEGKLNTERILGLRRLDIKEEKWRKAMEAISESIQVASTKSYIRMYKRQEDGSYKQINLDVASL